MRANMIDANVRGPSRQVRPSKRLLALFASAIVLAVMATVALPIRMAIAAPSGPSVLLVDSNLGDLELSKLHWLGNDVATVAQDGGYALFTSSNPQWWGEANSGSDQPAPSTFVLGCPEGNVPLDGGRITWALDQIRASGAEPRTFVAAVGPAGLLVREYVEDIASTKQSKRADIVGLGLLGVPSNGYTGIGLYPECKLWQMAANTTDFTLDDLRPQSERIARLNGSTFPRAIKTLVAYGSVGDLGFGNTDGAGVTPDLMLPDTVTTQAQALRVDATLTQRANLTSLWMPLTNSVDYPGRAVDGKLVERLSAMSSYPLSGIVQKELASFYNLWYAKGAPVTHRSDSLLIDLSGSMLEDISSGTTKLSAAKQALREYLNVTEVCAGLPLSPPMDVANIGFAEQAFSIADGYNDAARNSASSMNAAGETNIGVALERALATLRDRPTCATRHILLLSDGAATRGMSDDEMLSGPVASAKSAGIVIDCIGFGNVGESNESFLKRVAEATGGTYTQAGDAYSLRVNFLKSFYGSLGVDTADDEMAEGTQESKEICAADDHTNAIEATVVSSGQAPKVSLAYNGQALEATEYTVNDSDGLITVQCVHPRPGSYTLRFEGGSGKTHWFSLRQQGIAEVRATVQNQIDWGLILTIVVCVIAVISVAALIIRTLTKRR